MLELPSTEVTAFLRDPSARTNSLCDWLEGSVVFDDSEITQEEAKEILVQEHVVKDSEAATIAIQDAWVELLRRRSALKHASPYNIEARKATRRLEWADTVPYSFCLFLSLVGFYRPRKTKRPRQEFASQGRLFEEVTHYALSRWGWSTEKVGWSPRHAVRLEALLPALADTLGESCASDLTFHVPNGAKDGGLDLVLHRRFSDGWGARPVVLIQCASGSTTWEDKIGTPHPNVWDKLVRFPWPPMTCIAIPFALTRAGLYQVSERQAGLVLDRYRILASMDESGPRFPVALKTRLKDWLRPKLALLRSANG